MLSDSEKVKALEQVKRELRSILISEKHGVPLRNIENDYEMLSCNRLPYRDLGFKDVSSFMRSIPDVARENRLAAGDIVYFAVCDETTAHIQKLVSSQRSKVKKKSVGFRGRGGRGFRGGMRGGRGGRGTFSKPSFGGRPTPTSANTTFKPRPPQFTRGGGRWSRGIPRASRTTDPSLGLSGDIRNRGASKGGFSTFINVGKTSKEEDEWGDNSFNQANRFVDERERDWDKENQSSLSFPSPIHNLKIGVDNKGERTIKKNEQSDLREYLNSKGSRIAENSEEGDLRGFLNARKNLKDLIEDEGTHSSSSSSRGRGLVRDFQESSPGPGRKGNNLPKQPIDIVRQHLLSDRVLRRPNSSRSFNMSSKDIPPRFLRQQKESSRTNDVGHGSRRENISPIQHTEMYDKTTESKNWVTPENGDQYLQAFHDYFTGRRIPEPLINVVAGKIAKQKGFYGQINFEDKLYYPLEILHTEEEARQNAARAFCLKMGINLKNSIGGGEPLPPLSIQTVTQPSGSSSSLSEETKKRVYDIISETGVFAKSLPALYTDTYGEELDPNFLPSLQQASHLFNIEEPIPKRFIIYKVPEAMVRLALAHMEVKEEVQVPSLGTSILPSIGTEMKVMFSFAYSANELYVQKAENEDLLYQIEEFLETLAEQGPPQSTASLSSSMLIAACYEEGWYRAQVLTLEQERVSVFFVDYGNREQVIRTDVRLLPDKKLVTVTPPLAIPCCLYKPSGVEWQDDTSVSTYFTSLSESEPVLSAKVMDHDENLCIIELSLSNGQNLTNKLIKPQKAVATDLPSPSPSSPLPATSQSPPLPATTQSPPTSPVSFTSPTTAAVAALATPQTSSAAQKSVAVKLFADDPDPLCLPESEMFAVYVCRVLSESSLLLRIVDDEYSDKLDELECKIADHFNSWPIPKTVHTSNVYACVVLPDENDDEEDEEEDDEKKFHRVRVLRQNDKDNTYECYLLDHGDHETVPKEQLREIDSAINTSLSYQAILASLHNLDNLPSEHRAIATEILIKFTVTDCSTFMAMRRDQQVTADSNKMDPVIVNRVRKIICCLKEVDQAKVVDIYQKVYKNPLENVEEVIKQIPGYGFWRKSLEVELFDTSQDDDVSINNSILSAVDGVEQLMAQGKDSRTALHDVLGGSSSASIDDAATTDSRGFGEDKEFCDIKKMADSVNKQMYLDRGDVVKTEPDLGSLDRVHSYVQQQADSVAVAAAGDAGAKRGGSLYTWSTNVDNMKDAGWLSSKPLTTQVEIEKTGASGGDDGSFPSLPSWYAFEMNNFSPLFILQVESPSDFVAIPYDMRQPLLQMETQLETFFSTVRKVIEVLSRNCLYAVNKDGAWHRTLYISSIEHLHRVFYPDYHQFDTVILDQLFPLPAEFYALPFLGRKMALGAIAPNSQDWPESVKFWFIQATRHKAMYGLVWDSNEDNNNNNKDDRLPRPLTAQLVDTSGEEDVILDDVLCDKGWARHIIDLN